jgi:hypothetical protein
MPTWAKVVLGIIGVYVVLNIIVNIGASFGLGERRA